MNAPAIHSDEASKVRGEVLVRFCNRIVVLLSIGAAWVSAAAADDLPAPPFDLADRAHIEAGRARFGANCAAYCHGFEGSGGKTRPFRGRQDLNPAEVFKVITEGRVGNEIMPAWGNGFSEDKRWELVAYIMFLARSGAAPKPDVVRSTNEPPFDLSDPERIESGKLRFGANCAAYCHGFEGSGGKSPAFRGRTDLTRDDLFKVITDGRRGSDIMPAWGGLSVEKRWELVAYILHLTRQPPKP
jgi:mono/diheme cytochrome c family protein